MLGTAVTIDGTIERKHPTLPRFVVIPSKAVARWKLEGTTVVEGTLNGVDLGRRTIKRWDEHRWFIELPEPLCRKAEVDTGAVVRLALRVASDRLPKELADLIANQPAAKMAWARLTPSQQRVLRELVAGAKQPATRQRRANLGLLTLRCNYWT